MKKQISALLIFLALSFIANAQVYENPISGKQSHPEMEITKIEITDINTIISLKVTNKRNKGGWFCADKNIYITNSKGTEIYELISSENIPVCPNQYEFKKAGEILEFQLTFPKISDQIKFIDLIENCNNACFSFHGIILDNDLNEKIIIFETAFDLYQKNQFNEAIPYFEKVLEGNIPAESQIFGLSYYYLIIVNNKLDNKQKVNYWLDLLLKSSLSDKETFLKELKKMGIYSDVISNLDTENH